MAGGTVIRSGHGGDLTGIGDIGVTMAALLRRAGMTRLRLQAGFIQGRIPGSVQPGRLCPMPRSRTGGPTIPAPARWLAANGPQFKTCSPPGRFQTRVAARCAAEAPPELGNPPTCTAPPPNRAPGRPASPARALIFPVEPGQVPSPGMPEAAEVITTVAGFRTGLTAVATAEAVGAEVTGEEAGVGAATVVAVGAAAAGAMEEEAVVRVEVVVAEEAVATGRPFSATPQTRSLCKGNSWHS